MSILKLKTYDFLGVDWPRQEWYLLGFDDSSGTVELSYMDYQGNITIVGSGGSSGGTAGTSGSSGTDGSGTSGSSGEDGSGSSGSSGTGGDGTSGSSGAGGDGTSGSSGAGGDGTSGSSGSSGADGSGTSGSSGVDGSGTSGSSGADGSASTGWTEFGSVTNTSTSQFSVTDNATNQEIFKVGRPVRYDANITVDSTEYYYGIVTSYSSGTVTIAGVSFGAADTFNIDYGQLANVHDLAFSINGDYADGNTYTLLEDDLLMNGGYYWNKGRAFVVRTQCIVGNSGNTSAPDINIINVQESPVSGVFLGSLSVDNSLQDTLVAANSSNYVITMGDNIEIGVDPNGVTGEPRDLTVYITIIELEGPTAYYSTA